MNDTVDSTSDDRTINNVMRHKYRKLNEEEKYQMEGNLYSLSAKDLPVVCAIKNNNLEALKWLLEKGFNQKYGANIFPGTSKIKIFWS